MKNTLYLVLIFLGFTGCATQDLELLHIQHTINYHDNLLRDTNHFISLIGERMSPGITKNDVIRNITNISTSVSRDPNNMMAGRFNDGEPTSRTFEITDGVRNEIWVFEMYTKNLLIVFTNNRLSNFKEVETGNSLIDGLRRVYDL